MLPVFRTLAVIALVTWVSACTSGRAITPDERVMPIEDSKASVERRNEKETMAANNQAAISIAGRLADNDYRIGPDDVLEITVFQVEELSGEYTVNGRGELNMPLIGQIFVSQLTSNEIENG